MKSDRIPAMKYHGPALYRVGAIWYFRFQRDKVRIQRSTRTTSRTRAEELAWIAFGGLQPLPTLAELAETWETVHKATASPGHIRALDVFRRRHLYGLGGMRIDRIRTADVENTRNLHLDGRASESANHWLRNLKLLFGWAVRRDLIPSVLWKVKPLKVQKKPRVILPTAKASAWLAAVDAAAGARKGIGTVIRLMLSMGLREGEALGARWEWIDWQRSTYTPGVTKGKESVALPMPPWLVDHLEPMRAAEGPIVRSPRGRGGPYSPGSTRATIKKANAAAGVVGLSPHRLRGTFATLLSESGTPVQTIQRLLRHRDVKTTIGYCEIDMSRVVAAQNEIARKMGFSYLNPALPHDAGGRE